MENISDYTIYCTAEQTKLAMKLGAQIELRSEVYYPNGAAYPTNPTAEQMIGWLQSKGCYPYTMPLKRDGKNVIVARFLFYVDGGSTDTFCGFGEDNSVILNAIDTALTYLSNKK